VHCEATQFAVAAQNEVGRSLCLIGRSHGELGRLTAHLPAVTGTEFR